MGDQEENVRADIPQQQSDATHDIPSASPSLEKSSRSHGPQVAARGAAGAQAPHAVPHQEFNPAAYSHQLNQSVYQIQPQYIQPDPYGMSAMRQALPGYSSPPPYGFPGQFQSQLPIAGPPVVYQVHQGPHSQNPSYGLPTAYGSHSQTPYPPQYSQMSPVAGQFDQNGMSYQYYPDPYGRSSGSPTIYMQQVPQFHHVGFQTGLPSSAPGQRSDLRAARGPLGGPPYGDSIASASSTADVSETRISEHLSSSIPRGPPRKPKQSGHALWVGNLPPNTTLAELKDHFSKDATRDIASVFLISKSNCAFVNYRTEDACDGAVQRFNESVFKGLRLVCRQRKPANPGTGVPSGPSSMMSQRDARIPEQKGLADDAQDKSDSAERSTENNASRPPKSIDRFFIVKSLTAQDLEQSVRNGIWATQTHNEAALNEAYESADNVYLIFSANKSGEYFGFARMASPITENAAEVLGAMPRTNASHAGDAPKTIITHATEFAPRGRITDDSARGTIFWEAELSDDEREEEPAEDDPGQDEPETWGKPFKVEWVSTNRLPFYKTRGLRNPWNSNREVKIARDGTELEPGVGKHLLDLIHRNPPHLPTR